MKFGDLRPRGDSEFLPRERKAMTFGDLRPRNLSQETPKDNGGFLDSAINLGNWWKGNSFAGAGYLGGLLSETAGNILQGIGEKFDEGTLPRRALEGAGQISQSVADKMLDFSEKNFDVADENTASGNIANQLMSGLTGSLGSLGRMIHADKSADALKKASESTAEKNRVSTDDLGEYFTSSHGFWSDAANFAGQQIPTLPLLFAKSLPIIEAAVAKYGGNAVTQGLINSGRYGTAKWFAQTAPRMAQYAPTVSLFEAGLEGGETRGNRLAQGATEEEATRDSLITMAKNIPLLLATNTLESLVFFSPLRGANKALQIGERGAVQSLQQQYEEFAQEGIQNAALGKPYSWLPWAGAPEQYEAAERVRYPALLMGGLGGATQALGGTNENQKNWEQGSQENISNEDYSARANARTGIDNFMRAIVQQESGGNYDEVNADSGASGAFQIMPENWSAWATDAGLSADAPMTKENQDLVARNKMQEYYNKFGNWRDVAIAWYGGEGAVSWSEAAKNRPQGEYPSVNEYADSVMSHFKNFGGELGDTSQTSFDGTGSQSRGGNIFGVGNYDMPVAQMESSLEGLKPGWSEILPQIGGVLKNKFGYDPIITSGARTREHQMRINPSAPNSYHIIQDDGGDAVDIAFNDGELSAAKEQELLDYFKSTGLFSEVLYHAVVGGKHLHLGGLKTDNLNRGQISQAQENAYDPNFTEKQNEIWQVAQYASARAKEKFGYDIPPELIYKQWVQEAGPNFDSPNARYNNNFGGLTQVEPNGEENKQLDGNNYYRIFNNPKEYADAFVDDFIKYYPEINGVKTEREYASVLKKYGYFGSPLEEYIAGMEGAIAPSTRSNNFKGGAVTSKNSQRNQQNQTKPLFDLNSKDSTTQKLLEKFAREKRDSSTGMQAAEDSNFFEPMFTDKDVFKNTQENRTAILENYGDEFNSWARDKVSQSKTQEQPRIQTPPQIQPPAQIQAPTRTESKVQPKASAQEQPQPQIQVQSQEQPKPQETQTQNSQPQQDPVNQNKPPENILTQPKKNSLQERLTRVADSPISNKRSERIKQGRAIKQLAKQNQIDLPRPVQIALDEGSTKGIETAQNILQENISSANTQQVTKTQSESAAQLERKKRQESLEKLLAETDSGLKRAKESYEELLAETERRLARNQNNSVSTQPQQEKIPQTQPAEKKGEGYTVEAQEQKETTPQIQSEHFNSGIFWHPDLNTEFYSAKPQKVPNNISKEVQSLAKQHDGSIEREFGKGFIFKTAEQRDTFIKEADELIKNAPKKESVQPRPSPQGTDKKVAPVVKESLAQPEAKSSKRMNPADVEKNIYKIIPSDKFIDAEEILMQIDEIEPNEVSSGLTELEKKGIIEEEPSKNPWFGNTGRYKRTGKILEENTIALPVQQEKPAQTQPPKEIGGELEQEEVRNVKQNLELTEQNQQVKPATDTQTQQKQQTATFKKTVMDSTELKKGYKAILNAPDGTIIKSKHGGFGNPNSENTYVIRNGKLQPLDENGRNYRQAYVLSNANMKKFFHHFNTDEIELAYPEGYEQPAQIETPVKQPTKKSNKQSKTELLHTKLQTDTHPNLKAWLEAKTAEAATPEGKKVRAYLKELSEQDLNDVALSNAERTLKEHTKFFDDHVRSIESNPDTTAQQKQQAILVRKKQLDENRARLNFSHPSSKFVELNQKISQIPDKELQSKAKSILERGWGTSWDKQQKAVAEIEDLIGQDEGNKKPAQPKAPEEETAIQQKTQAEQTESVPKESATQIEATANELLKNTGVEPGSAYVRRNVTFDKHGRVVIKEPFWRDNSVLHKLADQFEGSEWEEVRNFKDDSVDQTEFIFRDEFHRDVFAKAANIFLGNSAAKYSKQGDETLTKADVKYIVENNLVANKDLTPQQKLIKSFGEKLGVKTVFFYGNKPVNGKTLKGKALHGFHVNNVNFINVNSKMPIGKVFWHESLHWLKANNPKLYQQLAKSAEITDAQRQAYIEQTGRNDLTTDAAIDEEIIADAFEDTAKRTGLLQNIAGKDRGLIERVVQWLKDTMNKFIDHFRNPDGKLTTKQSIALADEFGKIANRLKDQYDNKIFRYNRRTHNVEVIPKKPIRNIESIGKNSARPTEKVQPTVDFAEDFADNEEGISQKIFDKYLTKGIMQMVRDTVRKEIGEHVNLSKVSDPVERDEARDMLPCIRKMITWYNTKTVQGREDYKNHFATRIEYARRCFENDSRIRNESVKSVNGNYGQGRKHTAGDEAVSGNDAGRNNRDSGRIARGVSTNVSGGRINARNHFLKLYNDIAKPKRSGQRGVFDSRTQPKTSNEIKFSFAGKKAKTANLETLKQAKKMDERGADRDKIYETTGWFKGKDDKWRFEIPDNREGMNLKRLVERENFGKSTPLEEIYDNPELFAAYPQLRKITIKAVDPSDTGLEADLVRGSDAATVGKSIFFNMDRIFDEMDECQKTLVHELQHMIQGYERFAVGGNHQYIKEILRDEQKNITGAVANIKNGKEYFYSLLAAINAYKAGDTAALPKALVTMETAEQKISSKDIDKIKRLALTFSDLKEAQGHRNTTNEKVALYYRLGGEQESRHVEERLDNREGTPVVHDADALIVFGGKKYPVNKKSVANNDVGELVDDRSAPLSAATANGTTLRSHPKTGAKSDDKSGVRQSFANVDTNSPRENISQGRQNSNIKYSVGNDAEQSFFSKTWNKFAKALHLDGDKIITEEDRRKARLQEREKAMADYLKEPTKENKQRMKKLGVTKGQLDAYMNGEEYLTGIGLIQNYRSSPSRIADKVAVFRAFFRMGDRAQDKLVKLRDQFQNHYNKAMNFVKDEKAHAQLVDLLLDGDVTEQEFGTLTEAEVNKIKADNPQNPTQAIQRAKIEKICKEQEVSENVAKAYLEIRRQLNRTHTLADDAHRRPQNHAQHLSNNQYEKLRDNKFVKNLKIHDEQDDNGKHLVTWTEYANQEREYTVDGPARGRFLMDDAIQILDERQNPDGSYTVTVREGIPELNKIRGYIPHFFHEFHVAVKDANGKQVGDIIGTGRTQREAIKIAEQWKKNHPLKDGENIHITPRTFGQTLGVSENNTPIMGDKDFEVMMSRIKKNTGTTLAEAKQIVDGAVKTKNRHRFLGQLLKRKGYKGYEQDMDWVLRHHFNTVARYVALETEFKPKAISLFERVFGDFYKDHSKNLLAKYTKDYINDVNGNPAWIDEVVNQTLNQNSWWRKIFLPIIGEQGFQRIGNSVAGRIAYLKLGMGNISSALLNFTQLTNAAGYVGWQPLMKHFGRILAHGGKLNQNELRILNGSGVIADIGLDTASGYDKNRGYGSSLPILKQLDWLGNKSMIPFQKCDTLCRMSTALAAYENAIKDGKTRTQALEYAKKINRDANFSYGVEDAPNIFRRTSTFGKVGLQFMKYPIKQLEVIADFLPQNKKTTFKQKAAFWIPYFFMSGLIGFIPFFDWGDDKLSKNFNIFPKDFMQKLVIQGTQEIFGKDSEAGRMVGKVIMYGAPALANIDVSKRTGLASMLPQDTFSLLFGATGSTILGTGTNLAQGNYANALRSVSPGLFNIYSALWAGETKDARGRKVSVYEDAWDRIVRGLGFKSVDESLAADIQRISSHERSNKTRIEQRAIDDYIEDPSPENLKRLKELKIKPARVKEERKKKKLDRMGRTEQNMTKAQRRQNQYLMDFAK